jgi:hypothetical protein
MQSEELSHSVNHRGCGIRAASYPVAPEKWLPEACVWLQTEAGACRVWVHSFAHCFDAEKLTFPNKLDADGWALGAARTIIDRAFEQLASSVASVTAPSPQPSEEPRGAWRLARNPLQILRRFQNSRSR